MTGNLTRIVFAGCSAGLALALGSAMPAGEAHPSGPPAGLGLVPSLTEEFDGAAVDPSRWVFAYYDRGREEPTVAKRNLWSGGERQIYFDPGFLGLGINPFHVADGTLTITARPLPPAALAKVRQAVAAQPPRIAASTLREVTYSSGLISTRQLFAQRYGYFEMRARWSGVKGAWPEFWLLPQGGGWPPEIDILEAHGDKPGTAFQSIHLKGVDDTKAAHYAAGASGDYHVFGVLWSPKTLDWYVDGVKTRSMPTPATLDGPMYVIANLAIGGRWAGDPDPAASAPITMQIDYIRAWKFPSAP